MASRGPLTPRTHGPPSARTQRVRDQLGHAPQELGAHAGMEAIAVRAAEREQTERALVTERNERHGADIVRVRTEQQLTLRVAHLAATRLAAREQGLEGLEARVIRR